MKDEGANDSKYRPAIERSWHGRAFRSEVKSILFGMPACMRCKKGDAIRTLRQFWSHQLTLASVGWRCLHKPQHQCNLVKFLAQYMNAVWQERPHNIRLVLVGQLPWWTGSFIPAVVIRIILIFIWRRRLPFLWWVMLVFSTISINVIFVATIIIIKWDIILSTSIFFGLCRCITFFSGMQNCCDRIWLNITTNRRMRCTYLIWLSHIILRIWSKRLPWKRLCAYLLRLGVVIITKALA